MPQWQPDAMNYRVNQVMRRWIRLLIWPLVGLALAGVFMAYLNPHLAADLATRLWGCF